ncbi:MAG: glycosyltransferase family 2 protein [Hyphomicrobiales bacterium]|nr:glycosyltransferase family 2 protein [Hyphomicrobiales bacterium]
MTVNWNGWQNSLACLQALRASVGPSWHLILVDNASEDDSVFHLSGLGHDVTLIRSNINGGWTGGNNLGVQRALEDGYEFVFLLNNDAFVRPDTLSILMMHLLKNIERLPILGPVHRETGRQQYSFVGTTRDRGTGFWSWTPPDKVQPTDLHESFETCWIKGAGIFAHRAHFEKVGLFDERFFLDFDEIDWCYRATNAGYSLIMIRDAIIDHVGYASLGSRTSPLHTYFMTRNKLLFAEKHLSLGQRILVLRKLWWDARRMSGNLPTRLTLLQFLTARSGLTATLRRGMLDYIFRRFGDCPAIVRQWNLEVMREVEDS